MQQEQQQKRTEDTDKVAEEEEDEDNNSKTKKKKKMRRKGACGWLRDAKKVGDLVDVHLQKQPRLVEVPYTATLAHTINALVANNVVAVPVAAPPGRWIGAGGSMILESDPATGAVRKHYIGMVTMLDILVHIAEPPEPDVDDAAAGTTRTASLMETDDIQQKQSGSTAADWEKKMGAPVWSVIGHSLEGLSLWTLNPDTSILDCMETFSKGVHRALVPVESRTKNVIAVSELTEAAPGYRMLTQMDVLDFLRENAHQLEDVMSCSVVELGAVNENVFAVTRHTKVIEAIRSMRTASLNAVPIVEDAESSSPGYGQVLQDGKGKKLVDTFSATDLRACSVAQLQPWLSLDVLEFKRRASLSATADTPSSTCRKLVTCHEDTSLGKVIEDAVEEHVHRVWVVDDEGLLQGIVSLTDVLGAIREAVVRADLEVQQVAKSD